MSELRITYQIQLMEGQTIAFEIGEDTDIGPAGLKDILALVSGAAAVERAKVDLPMHKARLFSNREQLHRERRRLADAEARMQANVVTMSRGRNNPVSATPQDVNTVAQFNQAITNLEATIRNDELRIPYLEAIIDGRDPPELFPETLMAAE